MTKCIKYQTCKIYTSKSITCNDNSIAIGYCEERKDEVAPLIKKDNQLKKRLMF